jgi:hypothetical protein
MSTYVEMGIVQLRLGHVLSLLGRARSVRGRAPAVTPWSRTRTRARSLSIVDRGMIKGEEY